jgi:hypothetical protein
MTEQEIKDRIHELEKPDIERRNEIRSLRLQQVKMQQDKLRKLVGRCYRGAHKIFIIVGVPEPEFMMIGDFDFNPYQLPALIILTEQVVKHTGKTIEFGEIFRDTIRSRAVLSEDPVAQMRMDYEEITSEEFKVLAYKAIDDVTKFYTSQEEI